MQNVATAYDMGITEFDCSIGGMGGVRLLKDLEAPFLPQKIWFQWLKSVIYPVMWAIYHKR